MSSFIVENEECFRCGGSGEGSHDNEACYVCKGTGTSKSVTYEDDILRKQREAYRDKLFKEYNK